MRVRVFKSWRLAVKDCEECLDFIEKNEDRLRNPFSARDIWLVPFITTGLCLIILTFCLLWNHFTPDDKITSYIFICCVLGISSLIIICYFVSYFTSLATLRRYKLKVIAYESIYGGIVEAIHGADERGEVFLLEKREKTGVIDTSIVKITDDIVVINVAQEKPKEPQLLLEDKHAVVEEVAKTEEVADVAEVVENVEDEEVFTIEDLAARWASLYKGNPSTKTRPF